jgi:PAS domain S-box-containing protein
MKAEQPYRILVIDDDESVHGVYSCILSSTPEVSPKPRFNFSPESGGVPPTVPDRFPAFEIDFASQGQEGLERVRSAMAAQQPYTMAFVDVRMPPGWDGIETISHIWKECADLQVIICSAHADFSWQDLIRQLGHSDRLLVLKKPFDMTELRQVAYSLAEKWDLAHHAESHLQRLQQLVNERTAKLQEANHSLQRIINENKQAERRLVTQYSVSLALAQAATVEAAINSVFEIVCRSLNWDWAALWQVDAQIGFLKLTNQWNLAEGGFEAFTKNSRETLLEPGGGLPGRVWNAGQPVWVKDLTVDADFRRAAGASTHDLRTAVGFPTTAAGCIFGVVEFLSREVREQDDDILQTFAVIGSAIGQFIERKRAEEDLKQQRDYVDQIIRETPALVVGLTPKGIITFVNPSVCRHTGYDAGELIGQNWWTLLYPGDEDQQVEKLFLDLKTGPVRDYEMVLKTRQGARRTVSWNSMSKFNERGELIELIGFGNDITERKHAEGARAAMELQLRHAQKLESIGHLAAGIAHEINTPTQYVGDNLRFLETGFQDLAQLFGRYDRLLAAAKSNTVSAELIEQTEETLESSNFGFLKTEIPKAIRQSLDGVERIARIVGAMKDFSHPGTGQKTLINLNRAIENTLVMAGNELKHVAAVEKDFDPDLPEVPCLPGEFNQVILNIVVNAAQAISEIAESGGKKMGLIKLSTRVNGEWVEIRIRDTGPGIPEKIRDKIFDPFFTTKPVGKGTGQGLAICHAVVTEQHQGQLSFESEVGRGTEFLIRLPLQPAPRADKKGQR